MFIQLLIIIYDFELVRSDENMEIVYIVYPDVLIF